MPLTVTSISSVSSGEHLNGHSCKPQHSDDPAGSRGEAKIGIPTRPRRTMAGIRALTKKRKRSESGCQESSVSACTNRLPA